MNRRDYLKQMGLATAVTIGSNHLAGLRAFAGLSRTHDSSNLIDAAAPLTNIADWPPGSKPDPEKFNVKLIFAGICIFGSNLNEAHVAFHRRHRNTHKMKIIVSKKGPRCTDIVTIGDGTRPVNFNKMELGIDGKASDAKFFLGSEFDRKSNKGDELDFRWLLDLEGPEFYNKELKPKNNRKFRAKLIVRHGTFYTYQRTNTTFKAVGGPAPGYLGHIAKVMAANIELQDGESVYLKINGRNVLPDPLTNRDQHEIYFLNERVTGSGNDFKMAFDELDHSTSLAFSLDSVVTGDDTPTTGLCHNLPSVKRVTDEAPCMGASFGSGNGLK